MAIYREASIFFENILDKVLKWFREFSHASVAIGLITRGSDLDSLKLLCDNVQNKNGLA